VKPLLLGAYASGLLAMAVPAQDQNKQDAQKQLEELFTRLDTDQDGVLLRKEFPGSDAQFASMDTDKDGKVSRKEFDASEFAARFLRANYANSGEPRPRVTLAAIAVPRLDHALRTCDKNHDGKVTRDEWTGSDAAFRQLDQNGDGVLDRKDRSEAAAAAPPAEPVLPAMRGELPTAEELLKRYDKNGDGKIEQKELGDAKALLAALPRVDKNGDKMLDLVELRALVALLQKARTDAERGKSRPQPFRVPFDEWDKDKDGKIQLNEWQGSKNLFERIDLDRDAAITREELARYQKRVEGEDFIASFDLDGDGKVTLAEFGGPPEAFRRADRNGDGVISHADR